MSEELTKLAKLANSAAGDSDLELKLNTSLASPKMRALHLKDEIGPLGPPPGPPPSSAGLKMEEKVPMKMELGAKNPSQGMIRMEHMKGGGGGVEMKADGVMKKEEDDAVFLRDGPMNQVNNQMNSQMMTNGPQDDKGMNMLHRQVGGYPHPPNFTMQDSQHIYTFSTLLANRAAQAVYTGQTDSILAYHRAQSCKRKFLDPEEDTGAAPNHAGGTGPGTPQQNNTSQTVDGTTVQSASGQNGKPGSIDSSMDGSRKSIDGMKGKNPGTPQSVQEGIEGSENSRKTPLESGTGGGGTTTTKGTKKRKRPNSSSQPLQANLQGGGGPMQQGMPPSGPSFGPYGPGAYRPGFPPQNMPMRPPMSSQSFHNQPSTTETENLDPSALWENPPNVKKTMTTTMAPSFPPDMSPMRMASPNPAMRSPSAGLVLGNENMVPNPNQQGQRPFMSPSHPSQSLPASPVNPYDMPNYKPPQQIDNPTPEQLRHRQERLKTLKEMQKLLFPEEHGSMSPSPGRMMSPIGMPPPQDPMGQPQGMMSPGGGPMMRPMGPSGPMMGPGGPGGPHPMMHQGMGPGMHPRMPAQDGMRGISPDPRMMMANSGMMMPPLPPDWENMSPAQREWYKLQQEFYLDKRRKIMEDQAKMQSRMADFPPGPMGPGLAPGPMRGEPMMSPHHAGGFPGDVVGMNMGPPPPYPAGPGPMGGGPPGPGPVPGPPPHGMQRRASMSGPMPPMGPGPGPGMVGGPGGPGGMGGQNAPFPMSPHMPSPRTNRSSSVPGMQSGASQPPMSGGPGSMNPSSMPPGPQPGPGPVSSASSMSMANTMSPHAPAGSPMKPVYRAPTPTSANTSANQQPQQNTDPVMSSVVRTPGSVGPVEQSPRPNQPGTPAAMDNPVVMPNVSSVSTPNTSQPGTPNSTNSTMSSSTVMPPTTAQSNGAQNNATGGNNNVLNAPPPSTSNITNAPTPTSSVGTISTTAGNGSDSGKPMDVQSQQRLVNFPPSQLNRDKAPNFPPRGEDLQQYASTFYQKTVNKEPPMKGPGRLQHFGSPPMNSPINADMPTIGSPSSGIMSPGVMMTSQPGMMPPGGMPSQSGMMPHAMEGSGPQQSQQGGGPMMGPGHSPSGPSMAGGPPASSAMMNPRMTGPQQSMQSPMLQGQGPMMSSARMQQPGGMMSPQNSMMPPHNMPPQSGMMSPTMGPVEMMGPQGIPMSREQRMIMSQSRMMSQGHPMMEGGGGPGPMPGGGPGMMGPHPMERGGMMQGMNNFEPGMSPGMHPNLMRFSGPRGMPNSGFMEGGGMPSGPGRTNMPHPGMMGMGMGQGGPEMGVMGGMERNMGPATSGGQANSPLSLLQSRFSPPLLPDGKGPKQTLQYFPANTNQGSGQGQSGNPHVNPGTGPTPGQGPKQIELPFPVEMVTGGMNPGNMNPSFSRGPGAMGPGPRMSPMMNQEMMMHQGYGGMGPGGGPNPGPRGQVPGPNHMGYMGPRGMPGYGGMNPGGPLGPGGPPYGDPNFGPMGPDPMGPGFNMPK